MSNTTTDALAKKLSNPVGEKLGIKADSMISYKDIYLGFAPNYDPSVSMTSLNGSTGQKAATYNVYSQLTSANVNSGSYNGNDQYPTSDIIQSGAVLIASLMPTINWTDVTPGLCESVAEFFKNTFTSKGVTVWLRFAHEVNWYVVKGSGNNGNPEYPGGYNYAEYKTAWTNMYNAVKSDKKIFMYWCPNVDTSSEPVAPWWPGKDTVQLVGMDFYPVSTNLPTFKSAYGAFYDTYAKGYDLPFAIAETGTQTSSGTSPTTEAKETWLKAIINPASGFADYPLYCSCTWFEYGPPANSIDFYIVYQQSLETVKETISNTAAGS
ncbi:glycoside hydrolase [Mollisia scopiformis]|uniref:Glycoside hydrolase n=1 Tax=Mollisia scopiformis TaxID=149040 RepID=A0A194X6K8_MOLSC|nr:glycoside hydrolase [Mollisia scopiformis]KUJ15821.1 glycoside hydrolase [Mollisia scopiformis]